MSIENLTAYEIVEDREIKDLNSRGVILRHKKTGARIVLLSNDDPNKVFYIGFRTPPTDSTGVAHIIEHSVLCGSEKYPVKDPFVELAKGSLNTFLNAMTYPDKTVLPIFVTSIWMRYSIRIFIKKRRSSSRRAGIMNVSLKQTT